MYSFWGVFCVYRQFLTPLAVQHEIAPTALKCLHCQFISSVLKQQLSPAAGPVQFLSQGL